MSADLLALMWFPFLMCLVLTGIHAYLGFHVIAREVVFVDIALAQIAALGATAAFLVGYELETWESYAAGLGFTVLGALVLALTRSRTRRVSHEAVIGVVYAVSSAGAVLLADRSPHGAEHLRGMLVGSILSVRGDEVLKVAILYALVGLFHWLCRRPVLPDLHRSGPRVSRGLAGARVGLRLLRLLRRGRDLLGAHRGRAARLLVPDRARAGRHPARLPHRSAPRRRLGLRRRGEHPGDARLRGARPAHRRHRGLRVRPEPPRRSASSCASARGRWALPRWPIRAAAARDRPSSGDRPRGDPRPRRLPGIARPGEAAGGRDHLPALGADAPGGGRPRRRGRRWCRPASSPTTGSPRRATSRSFSAPTWSSTPGPASTPGRSACWSASPPAPPS